MSRIAHKGLKGSFTYLNALNYFGKDHDFIGLENFNDIFDQVWRGYADFGVVPIENSLVGSIYENYDALCRYPVSIVGESYLRVEHFLVGAGPIDRIKKVYSHPKALEQCSQLFKSHPWFEKAMSSDTASAAEFIARSGDRSLAAISSAEAAKLYGLSILIPHIEDDPLNFTRFIVIAKKTAKNSSDDKCSLMLKLKHIPGALSNVLNLIAAEEINLTKIESRPLIGKPFEYLFYLDLTSPRLTEILESLIKKIEPLASELKLLGLYKMKDLP